MAPPIKSYCQRGHKFTPSNTRMVKLSSGYTVRQCRRCRNMFDQMRYHTSAKRREAVLARANMRNRLSKSPDA